MWGSRLHLEPTLALGLDSAGVAQVVSAGSAWVPVPKWAPALLAEGSFQTFLPFWARASSADHLPVSVLWLLALTLMFALPASADLTGPGLVP